MSISNKKAFLKKISGGMFIPSHTLEREHHLFTPAKLRTAVDTMTDPELDDYLTFLDTRLVSFKRVVHDADIPFEDLTNHEYELSIRTKYNEIHSFRDFINTTTGRRYTRGIKRVRL